MERGAVDKDAGAEATGAAEVGKVGDVVSGDGGVTDDRRVGASIEVAMVDPTAKSIRRISGNGGVLWLLQTR